MTFYDLTIAKTLQILKTSESGLSTQAAEQRLKRDGRNELPKDPPASWLKILIAQFLSPLMVILIVAMGVSMVFGDHVDAIMILAAIVINVVVGFVQEFKADRALQQLRSFSVLQATVRRDGHDQDIPAIELVAGDLVLLEPGDRVPADARVIQADNVEVDEAVLTGESLPVEKREEALGSETPLAERSNMVYSGTLLVRGRAQVLVSATGVHTEIGSIAQLVSETEAERSPLQVQFIRLSRFLALLYSVVALAIMAIGLLLGKSLAEMFVLAVALAVAAVPEGLLVAVTVVLAVGMQRMLKRKALVRKLVATETLGSVSVICTDKTGTITQASMQVVSVVTADQELDANQQHDLEKMQSIQRAVEIGVLCNDASISDPEAPLSPDRYTGSPTEVALLMLGEGLGLEKTALEAKTPRSATFPFGSEHKFMLVATSISSGSEILMKGAAEVVIGASTKVLMGGKAKKLGEAAREDLLKKAEVMTERGLRVLGCAYRAKKSAISDLAKEDAEEMVFVGFVGLRDPVRASAKETLAQAAQAGVRTVVITGDHPRTARAIAREVGLGHGKEIEVLTGRELDELSEKQFQKAVTNYDVYARVEPVHKVRIVQAWRAQGSTVAMVGDGVNDAPALKAADIGVAQGNGTDVTKQVADMVLLDSNLKTIVAAIEEGRVIFDNIRKTSMYLLLTGFSEMSLILLSLILGLPLPLVAAQILYINFVTDGLPAIALTVDPKEAGTMQEPPRLRGTPILDRKIKGLVFGLGTLMSLLPFSLYAYFIFTGADHAYAQTMVFAILSIQTVILVFSIRTTRHFVWKVSALNNRFLLWSVAGGFALTFVAVYWGPLQSILSLVPLGLWDWGVLSIIVLIKLVIIEVYKYFAFMRPERQRS